MKAMQRYLICISIAVLLITSVSAEEEVRWDIVEKIKAEAFNNSHAMENVSWIADVFGPREANTIAYREAAEWAKDKLKEYGISNTRLEPYKFGVGYEIEYVSAHMMEPKYMPIIAYPAPWSSGTDGRKRASVIYINFDEITSKEDLEQYEGKLKDKIIFISPIRKVSPHFEPMATLFTEKTLDDMSAIPIKPEVNVMEMELSKQRRPRRGSSGDKIKKQEILDFVFGEGAVAIVHPSSHDFGTVSTGRYNRDITPWEEDAPRQPTELILAVEQYNRIMRILEKDIEVELEIEVRMSFNTDDLNDHNVLGEIPGTDKADEIVLCGGHLHSVPIGTGATDNAVGVSVAMEAVRILKAIGVKPRRTIRVGFWSAHELGLIGNRAHVRMNYADRKAKEYKEDYKNFVAYFDNDHGTGKIRAVSTMGNEEIRGIFTEWMKPLHTLGMSHMIPSGVSLGGNPGYHEAYAEVGLPGFYFYQDRMDMDTNAHTNMDMVDRINEENLKVNAVILATFVYHAAMREEKLPRIAPLPW